MIRSFQTARDFVAFFLEDVRFSPRNALETVQRGRGINGYVFRGQASRAWSLLPAAHREGGPLRQFTPQSPGSFKDLTHLGVHRYIGIHLHAELRAVQHFLEEADRLGIPTPLDYVALQKHQATLDAFLEGTGEDLRADFPRPEILPGVALAQHHGVPTRLLDWTEAPLVAAYFAAEGCSSTFHTGAPLGDREIAVLILETFNLHRSDQVRLASAPRFINTHLRAQRGIFVYLPHANTFFLDHQRWPTVEDGLDTTADAEDPLDVATLPAERADELLRLLWSYEVTRHHLMPTLDHAARAYAYAKSIFSG